MRSLAVLIVLSLGLHSPAIAAVHTINNPANKISNPADKIFNPATQIDNAAINIYNPAGRMDNPNPLSPPTQPPSQPTVTETSTTKPEVPICEQPKPKPVIPEKRFNYKYVKTFIKAAKIAFYKEDYMEFLSITEDALRRIKDGTLKASKNSKQKLLKYNKFGYGLLEEVEE